MYKRIADNLRFRTLIILIGLSLSFQVDLPAQTLTQQLQKAFSVFENDSQLSNASSSLYVIDALNGKVIFDKNSRTGLAPASTQKLLTSVTALALLGKDFRYTTSFATGGDSKADHLYVFPSGDPTLGSERWSNTKADNLLRNVVYLLKQRDIKINKIIINTRGWESDDIPDGWIWQDIGNYYGAGSGKLNWRENQYDVLLRSGKNIGDPVRIVGSNPGLYGFHLNSEAKAAARGTGDNAYIYLPVNGTSGVVKGTIPVNENGFGISGAFPSGAKQFGGELSEELLRSGLTDGTPEILRDAKQENGGYSVFFTQTSPPLDSIIYWFNQKSINLYGEALLKTISAKEKGYGITDSGVIVVKDFWKQRGIRDTEINIVDGSGLSPLNRVTTHSQVAVLQYARAQPWFNHLYRSLPTYNGMKMKSGTINNVKGFTGIHSTGGKTYIFSFLVNNYNGSAAALVRKMYAVLDILKQ
ncbi:MAG: D-alanyl-D-alanine carboxypeptidase/D-alanyl-D-alanine-endopeptidase [Chitinophagaceae bacterium]|nr:D-alanyl-D-alanine carboxypeptidase/D-alanyl-D-alanine-endopeptidase [Chitinophagaceae bacterium]